MSHVVRIPLALYSRLEKHAQGFDTPANVIERLLDFYDSEHGIEHEDARFPPDKEAPSLEIIFYPGNEKDFKNLFLQKEKAFVKLHYVDGSIQFKEWNLRGFTERSNVSGNLKSGYLRGWKQKGIFKAEVSTDSEDLK